MAKWNGRRPGGRKRRSRGMPKDQRELLAEQLMIRAKLYFESLGWLASIGEFKSITSTRKHDLFGFADILAHRQHPSCTVLVQVTTVGCVGARMTKIAKSEKAKIWLKSHEVFVVAYHTDYSIRKYGVHWLPPQTVTCLGLTWKLIRQESPLIYKVV